MSVFGSFLCDLHISRPDMQIHTRVSHVSKQKKQGTKGFLPLKYIENCLDTIKGHVRNKRTKDGESTQITSQKQGRYF